MFSTPARRYLLLATVLVLTATLATPLPADDADGYRLPSPALVEMVDAPPTPLVSVAPGDQWMLLLQSPNLPPIAELAERELRLAGLRIKPQTNGPSRTRPYVGLELLRIDDLKKVAVTGLPVTPRIGNVRWSPDGEHFCFTNTGPAGIELWVTATDSGQARRLTGPVLNLAAGTPPSWLDNQTLACTTVPEGRPGEPVPPAVPSGPIIQENLGGASPNRTYQDLLKNPHDEALFEYYCTSRMALVDLDGNLKFIGGPEIVWDFDPSPDGNFIIVETLHRPWSYLVPASRFPRRLEIRGRDGSLVHLVADKPLQESIPIAFGSVATGPRSLGWRADTPDTVSWVEALDGGDAGTEAENRDRVFTLAAPFDGDPQPLITTTLRYGGITWGSDGLALASEWWWKTRMQRVWKLEPGHPDAAPVMINERSFEDRYNDPGNPLTKRNAMGRSVLLTGDEGKTIYLLGSGASPEGDRPFLDIHNLDTGEKDRRFHSAAPYYERPVTLLGGDLGRMLTRRESVEEPPNYFVRDLKKETLRQVTTFSHPTPQLVGLSKEQIRYERDDGVMLTATLFLPPGYSKEQGPLPLLMWAYPQEFKSADAASQVTDSPYRFSRVGWWSPLLFLAAGYAVLDDPAMPIVGEGDEEPNDTFIRQLVASAQAAADEVVGRGVASPYRLAVGGHSYGAFMTANLLAHSDIYAAGIARSGAYNRTLTPFGFQSEERSLWEAPDIYVAMSPFMHAEKVNEPLLLIHGEADNNSGTFPMQSERYYNALKGHGATTRLCFLPHESHGYRARESVLHMLWETEQWMDTYVKAAEPPAPEDEVD